MLPYHVSGVGCFAGSLPCGPLKLPGYPRHRGRRQYGARIFALAARALGAASHAALWDRGLVAEVGAAAPRRCPMHTVYLSAGSILQTRHGRPRLHLEREPSRQGADDKQGSCGHGLILEEQEAEGEPQ